MSPRTSDVVGGYKSSLLNRRKFFSYFRKTEAKLNPGEREARVAREETRTKKNSVLLPSFATRVSRSPRFRLYSSKMRKKIRLFAGCHKSLFLVQSRLIIAFEDRNGPTCG